MASQIPVATPEEKLYCQKLVIVGRQETAVSRTLAPNQKSPGLRNASVQGRKALNSHQVVKGLLQGLGAILQQEAHLIRHPWILRQNLYCRLRSSPPANTRKATLAQMTTPQTSTTQKVSM